MKKNMCLGCEYLTNRIQKIFYNNQGYSISPIEVMKPFCRNYQLHLEYIDRIHEENEICSRYL